MALRRSISLGLLGVSLSLAALLAAGCKPGSPPSAPAEGTTNAAMSQPAQAPVSTTPVSDRAPNELGRVPVLEYHEFAAKEARWTRTPENFRKDLEWLYSHGFRPISVKEYVTGDINLPKGASPVVFTFDDSRPGQFRYIEKDGKQTVDPDCAVGILEAFHQKHPDWALKGTFYVLKDYGFGDSKTYDMKLKHLVEDGFDLGNHTISHNPLRKMTDAQVQEELAGAQKQVQAAVPGYEFYSIALPLGIKPKNEALAAKGTWQGMSYDNRAVFLVGSFPASSPYAKKFDPAGSGVQRIQATDELTSKEAPYRLTTQLTNLVTKPGRCYVSDGDPKTVTVPAADKDDVDTARLSGKSVKTD